MNGLHRGEESSDHVRVDGLERDGGGGSVEDVVCADPERSQGRFRSGDVGKGWLGVCKELLSLVHKRNCEVLVSRSVLCSNVRPSECEVPKLNVAVQG